MLPVEDPLARHFADLSDDALQRVLVGGDLTDAARDVAEREIAARGLVRGVPPGDSPTPVAAPVSTAPASARSPGEELFDALGWLGWIYLSVWLALLLYGAGGMAARLPYWSASTIALACSTTALDALAALGFWRWMRARPVGPRALWLVCGALKSLQLAYAANRMIAAHAWPGALEITRLALHLPMLGVMWRCALAPPRGDRSPARHRPR